MKNLIKEHTQIKNGYKNIDKELEELSKFVENSHISDNERDACFNWINSMQSHVNKEMREHNMIFGLSISAMSISVLASIGALVYKTIKK